jgi:hypothetical protein
MTSFLRDGLSILRIASTFMGLASMPRCPTMKPRSNLEGTPKTHLVRLPLELSQVGEGFGGLVDHIVYVSFNVPPDLRLEALLYRLLICRTSIF